jgi:hypothetical protein
MNIRSGINWTKSAIVLALLCAFFSFSAKAQNNPNKALDEESVAALVEELTDGLPDLIDDEDQLTAITEKWNARQNLTGKTKAQILNLLFADVRSIVKDKEIQDSIWADWKESASNNTETDDSDDNTNKHPVATVTRSTPVTPQPVTAVTRELNEPFIETDEFEPIIIKSTTVPAAIIYTHKNDDADAPKVKFFGNYIAEIYEPAPNCVRPPGSRLSNGPCVKAYELKVPEGAPPEFLCERKEGKGNCRQYKNSWIAKTCKYGYRYWLAAEGLLPIGSELICTSGKSPVPGALLP